MVFFFKMNFFWLFCLKIGKIRQNCSICILGYQLFTTEVIKYGNSLGFRVNLEKITICANCFKYGILSRTGHSLLIRHGQELVSGCIFFLPKNILFSRFINDKLHKKIVKFLKGKIKVFVLARTGQKSLRNANKWLPATIDYWYQSVIAHMKRTYNSVIKNGKSRISN